MASSNTKTAEPVAAISSKQKTISRLLKVAHQEFAEKGLAGTRIEDIARAAGVTKQLVYHYFFSKEQLLACVLDASAEAVLAAVLAMDVDHLPPAQALRKFLCHALDQYRDDPTLGTLALEGLNFHERQAAPAKFPDLVPALNAQAERILQRGIAQGVFRAGIDARMFFAAASLLTTGGYTNRYTLSAVAGFDTGSPEGAAAWRQYSVDFVMAAILVEQAPALGRPAASGP